MNATPAKAKLAIRNGFILFCSVNRIKPADTGKGTTLIVEKRADIKCEIPPTQLPRLIVCFSFSSDFGTTCLTAVTAAIVFETKINVKRIDVIAIPVFSFGTPQANISGNLIKEVDSAKVLEDLPNRVDNSHPNKIPINTA